MVYLSAGIVGVGEDHPAGELSEWLGLVSVVNGAHNVICRVHN